MNIEYTSIEQYLECHVEIIGHIQTYDMLIKAMQKSIAAALLAPDGQAAGQYAEYELDDGQCKVRSRYRSVDQMITGLQGLRRIRQDYINQYNGRVTTLRGGNL